MKKVMIVLGTLVLVALAGCGQSEQERSEERQSKKESNPTLSSKIIGKWKIGTDQDICIVQFLKDGTVITTGIAGVKEKSAVGSYKFIDDKQIKIDFSAAGGPTDVSSASISGDKLILTSLVNGEVSEFQKWSESDEREKKAIKEQIIEQKARVSGKYVTDDPAECLVLKENGSFYLWEKEMERGGEFEIKEGKILLVWVGKVIQKGEIKGNTIVDEAGKVWVKKDKEETNERQVLTPAPVAGRVPRSRPHSGLRR